MTSETPLSGPVSPVQPLSRLYLPKSSERTISLLQEHDLIKDDVEIVFVENTMSVYSKDEIRGFGGNLLLGRESRPPDGLPVDKLDIPKYHRVLTEPEIEAYLLEQAKRWERREVYLLLMDNRYKDFVLEWLKNHPEFPDYLTIRFTDMHMVLPEDALET